MEHARPKRRAAWAAGFFAAGIAAAHAGGWDSPAEWFAAAAVASAVAWVARGWTTRALLAVAVFALGAAWFIVRVGTLRHDDIARFLDDTPKLVTVEGMVVRQPEVRREARGRLAPFVVRPPRTVMQVRIERVVDEDGVPQPASGRLWVGVGGDASDWRAGDRVRLVGMARATRPPMNPGEIDIRPWARVRGVSGSVDVDSGDAITAAKTAAGLTARVESAARRAVERLRSNARSWLDADDGRDAGQGEARALLRALLLGQHDADASELRDAFTRLGIAHVLSISGLHLALLAGALMLVFRATGDRPRVEALITAAAVGLYLLVVPARAPVVRAAIMVWAFLAAESTGRRYDRLTVLAWVMVLVLALRPMELFSVGFQLSFGVVAGLMLFTRPLRTRLFGERPHTDTIGTGRRLVEAVKESAAAAVVAWLVASPIIAHHLGIFSPLGIPATVVLLPIVSLIIGAGYLILIAALIVPVLGEFAAPVLTWLAWVLSKAVYALDAAPWSVVFLPRLDGWWCVAATAVVCWWLWPTPLEGFSARVRAARWSATLAAVAWLAFLLARPDLRRDEAARIDMLAVGDGSCLLVRAPGRWGRADALLYDCGSMRLDVGEQILPAAIRALGAWRVPSAVVSHPDLDHYCAVPDVIQRLGVGRLMLGEAFLESASARPDGPAAFVLDDLRRRGLRLRTLTAGESSRLGGATIDVLSPPRGARWRRDNDASLVLLLTVPTLAGERRILFTGDIEREAMASLMESRPDLRADILEAPHHGSYNHVAEDFIRFARPSVVLQSTGERRLADERWDQAKQGRTWLMTARDGAVSVIIRRDGTITTTTWRR